MSKNRWVDDLPDWVFHPPSRNVLSSGFSATNSFLKLE